MLFNNKYSIFFFVLLALVLGGLSSSNTATDSWYISLTKSSLNPPGFVFGIVWPILYCLMSISAYRTFVDTKNLFFIQLFFNAIWSWLFFAYQLPLIALLNIWLLIFLNIKLNMQMYRIDRFSGIIYLPYVIWLIFASYLNLFIVINN
ncbi:MAG: tryptophan-rich sensory protein [Proteobacteria bacterium]|nr:tryptophan-rich sensory protein [Pseudomonadota bacterium]